MPKISEAWPGNNRFFCDCCVTGPLKDLPGMLFIYFCQLAMIVPYTIFMFDVNWKITPLLPILFYSVCLVFNIMMFLTACTDPGIIPRKPFLEREP